MKNYLYGIGRELQLAEEFIDWSKIDGVVDSSVSKIGSLYKGYEILAPCEVAADKARFIITTAAFYEEISFNLSYQFNVSAEYIMGLPSWLAYQYPAINGKGIIRHPSSLKDVFDLIAKHGIKRILDYTQALVRYGVINEQDVRLARWHKGLSEHIDCWQIAGDEPAISNPYWHYISSLSEVASYDALLIMDADLCEVDSGDFAGLVHSSPHYIIISLAKDNYSLIDKFTTYLSEYSEATTHNSFAAGNIFIWERKSKSIPELAIFAITHKKAKLPVELEQAGVKLLFAGANNRSKQETCGYLRDDEGDNISTLNASINECTAIYWLWKNTKSQYVGLCHYRRFFLQAQSKKRMLYDMLYPREASAYLADYDIILIECTQPIQYGGVYNMLAESIDRKTLAQGMDIVRGAIQKRQPDYTAAFDYVMNGVSFYPCNMFITSRDVFYDYCTWLFSFIIEATNQMDISSLDNYNKRVIGFIAERLLTVWLIKQNLRIKMLPFTLVVGV